MFFSTSTWSKPKILGVYLKGTSGGWQWKSAEQSGQGTLVLDFTRERGFDWTKPFQLLVVCQAGAISAVWAENDPIRFPAQADCHSVGWMGEKMEWIN